MVSLGGGLLLMNRLGLFTPMQWWSTEKGSTGLDSLTTFRPHLAWSNVCKVLQKKPMHTVCQGSVL